MIIYISQRSITRPTYSIIATAPMDVVFGLVSFAEMVFPYVKREIYATSPARFQIAEFQPSLSWDLSVHGLPCSHTVTREYAR